MLGLIAALPLAILGTLGLRTSADADATSQELVTNVIRTHAAGQLDMYHDALRGVVYEARTRGPQSDDSAKREILAELAEIQFDTDKAIGRLRASHPDPDIQQSMADVMPLLDRYRKHAEDLVQQALSGTVDNAADEAFKKDFTELEQSLEKLSKSITDDAKALEKRQQTESDAHMAWLGGGVFVLLLLTLATAEFLSRRIWRQLGAEPMALRQFALKLASGDLLGEISGLDRRDRDHMQSVAGSMMKVRDDLHAAVTQVRDSSRIVTQACEETAHGSADMCPRIERQSSHLQQAAAAMEQMCWRSTRLSRQPVPATTAADSRSLPPRCAAWPSAALSPRRKSAARSRRAKARRLNAAVSTFSL